MFLNRCCSFARRNSELYGLLLAGLLCAWMTAGAQTTEPSAAAAANSAGSVELTGTLEDIIGCDFQHRSERWYEVIEDKTGLRHRLQFDVELAERHRTGDRVRVRGLRRDGRIQVRGAGGAAGLEVIERAKGGTEAGPVTQNSLYPGGTNTTTNVRQTLVMLLNYTNWTRFTAADVPSFSNKMFSVSGPSVNAEYLEQTYGKVGFAGKVLLCSIQADANGCPGNGTGWFPLADAEAIAQGENPASYTHKVYIVAGACGWAGLAAVGGNWSMDYYTDGGTISHELGHNLGFGHASAQWNNTSAWDEYGDSSDFMGSSYDWRHNNGPHKVKMGWVTPQSITGAGVYQVSRLEDEPATMPYPQVLTFSSSAPPSGWPYYLSYKQRVGYDANVGWYADGLSIHRWGGGNPAIISVLWDGGTFTDSATGMIIRQISHDTNSVTIGVAYCMQTAQPYGVALTAAQLTAQTPVLMNVAPSNTCDPITITSFDATSAKGGSVVLTNSQLRYTPPGNFAGNDSFNFTVTDVLGLQSSAAVTIYNLGEAYFEWDANGAVAGTGGSGTWDTTTANWNNGANTWPASGTTNLAWFGGTSGTVAVTAGGVTANRLVFSTEGYLLQGGALTLNGTTPTILSASGNATIAAPLAGTAGLAKEGAGELTLTASNTYSGTTVLLGGKLTLGGSGAVLGASGLTIATSNGLANGTSGVDLAANQTLPVINFTGSNSCGFRTRGFTATVAGLNCSNGSGVIENGGYQQNITNHGVLNVNIPGSGSWAYNGLMRDADNGGGTGTLYLLKSGTGTLTLSGNSSYSGGTTLSAGTIVIKHGNALGTGGTVTLADTNTGANNITLNLDATSGSVTLSRPITIAGQGSGTATLGCAFNNGANAAFYSGAITLGRDVILNGTYTGDRFDFSGGIGGIGNVTIAGNNRVIFMTSPNTFAGNVTINAGATLQLSDGTSTDVSLIPDASAVAVNGTLNLAKGPNSETLDVLTGSGIVRGHPGVGGVASAVVLGAGNGSGAFSGVLGNGGASGATLAVVKVGTGIQTLAGANTYTGPTTISNGSLVVQGSLNTGSTVTVVGGALSGTGTVGGATTIQSGGTIAPGTNAIGTLTINNILTLSGTARMRINKVSASADKVQGVSTLTYGGTLAVTNLAGTLVANDTFTLFAATSYAGAFSSAVLPNVASNLTWDLSSLPSNGTIKVVAFTGVNPPLSWPANLTATAAGAYQINVGWSPVAGAASYVLSRDGAPIATLTGTNCTDGGLSTATTYCYTVAAVNTGGSSSASPAVCATTYPAGVAFAWDADNVTGGVQDGSGTWGTDAVNWLYNGNQFPWVDGNLALFGAGTTTNCTVTITNDVTPVALTFASNGGGSYTIASGGGGINLSNSVTVTANNAATISAVLKGSGSLVKSGANTLTLSSSNTYTGGTTVSQGTLVVNGAQEWNSGSALGGNLTIASGATANFNGSFGLGGNATTSTIAVNGTLNLGNGQYFKTINMTGGTINAGIATSADRFRPIAGGGTIHSVVSGTQSTIALTGGTYGVTLDVGPVTFNVEDGAATTDLLVSAPINGGYGLTKTGAGTLALSGNNSHTGGTTLSAGTIVVKHGNALGTGGTVIINDAGTTTNTALMLDATSVSVTVGRPITVSYLGAGTTTLGCSFNSSANAAFFSGVVTLARDVILSGSYTGDRFDFTGGITGAGNVTIAGNNRVIFMTSANTFTGSLTINGGATLQLSDGTVTSVSLIPDASAVTVNGTLNLAKGANSETMGALSGSGIVQGHPAVSGVASALVIGGDNGSGNFSGVLRNGGAAGATLAVTKTGAGMQTLSGASTYTGPTTVSDGTLLVNGSLNAGSAVTVVSNATLGGTGTVGGAVTINGSVSPGASVGTLATGAETWNGGGSYLCEINSTNVSGSDRLNITGALTIGATAGNRFIVRVASLTPGNVPGSLGGFDPSRNYSWTIASASSLSGFDSAKFTVSTAQFNNAYSGTFSVTSSGSSVLLQYLAPMAPPVITGSALAPGGAFQLTFTGQVGQAFSVRATNNLVAPILTWPVLTNGTIGGSGIVNFTDPVAATNAQRFYRITSP